MKEIARSLAILFVVLGLVRPASAQSRPLVTEDPETVPAGFILLEAGFDLNRDVVFPVSGLTGNLTRIGTFGLSIGVSSIAEIQIDGGLRNRLAIMGRDATAPLAFMLDAMGESTSDFEDFSIGAKVKVATETPTRPAIAIRFSTRLPNAGNESGLGLDTTDFNFGILMAKTVRSVRVAGNVGFGILGDPVRGDRQNDVLNLGGSVARALAPGVEIVGGFNARINTRSGQPPIGTDSKAVMRVGSRLTRGPVRIDGALLVGVTERDPSWGLTFGVTWVFKAFEVQ